MSNINSLQRTHIKDAPTQYFGTTWRNHLLRRHDCSITTQEKVLNSQARTKAKWKVTNSGRTVLYYKPIEHECEFCFSLNWRPAVLSSNILQSESVFRNRILASGKTTVRPCLEHVSAPLFPNFVLFLIFVTSLYAISQTSICAIEFFWDKTLSQNGDLNCLLR